MRDNVHSIFMLWSTPGTKEKNFIWRTPFDKNCLLSGVLHMSYFLHSYGVLHAVKFTKAHSVLKTVRFLKDSMAQIVMQSNFLKDMEFFKYRIFE